MTLTSSRGSPGRLIYGLGEGPCEAPPHADLTPRRGAGSAPGRRSITAPLTHQSAAWCGTRKTTPFRPVLIHAQESSTSQCSRGPGQEALRHPSSCPAGRRDAELVAPKLLDPRKEEPSPAVGEARGRRACVCGGGRLGRRPV